MLITMMLAERQFKPLRPVIDSQDLEDFNHYKKYCTHQNALCWTTDSFGRGRAGITSI